MAFVKNILAEKEGPVWSVTPETSVVSALQLMAEKKVGAVLVINNGTIEGIFSERDYARKVAETECICLDVRVREMMTHPIYFASPEQTVEECMTVMTARRIRHLPVLEDGKLVGIISIRDVVDWILSEKDTTIKGLENYILGTQVIE